MKRLRTLRAWSDDHPVLSIIAGLAVLWLFAMVCLPADPPYVNQAAHVVTGHVRDRS